jgi:ABC-type multidrug transport system ATPase subunit
MNKGKIVACGTPLELKQLAGQEAILEATARHFPPAVVEAIRQMRGVRAAAAAPAGSDGLEESLRVHSDDPERLVGAIADMLQQYGVDAELQVVEPALEDAFIALTDRRLE